MKDRTKIRTGKRIMAALLSFVMVFGIFSGMKLDAEAREGKVYKIEDLKDGTVLYNGDVIEVPQTSFIEKKGFMIRYGNGSRNITEKTTHKEPDGKIRYRYVLPILNIEGKFYNTFLVNWGKEAASTYANSAICVILSQTTFEEKEETPAPVISDSHTCNFQWITTIDPEVGMDGLEEYKCVECGAVQESHPIPASVAAVKDLYGKVKDAPANGTVTYDSGKLYTISDYLLKKMSERSDVTLTVNFEYQNAKYELTFPAGTDYTPVLTDEETMYGYFGVAAKLGLTVAAK